MCIEDSFECIYKAFLSWYAVLFRVHIYSALLSVYTGFFLSAYIGLF